MPLPLALTLGEPAGIGPDLAIAVWRRRAELNLPPFYVTGDPAFLTERATLTGAPVKPRQSNSRNDLPPLMQWQTYHRPVSSA